MKKKIDADECDAAFALAFFHTALVNISLPVLFYVSQFFVIKLFLYGVSRLANILTRGY